MNTETLGVDIGGVIINRMDDPDLWPTAVHGVFNALRQLVEKRFEDRVFLVSKCSQRGEDKILHWLDHHHFYDLTRIGRDHVRFCRERHEKAGICEKLGITHFIDNRLEVLGSLTTVGTLYFFRHSPDKIQQSTHFLSRVHQVNSWQEILKDLLL